MALKLYFSVKPSYNFTGTKTGTTGTNGKNRESTGTNTGTNL